MADATTTTNKKKATEPPVPSSSGNNNIPISLGKPSLRRRLEAYYSLVNPESIQDTTKWRNNFDQIYGKYGGSYEGERKLATKLAKKYGSTVRLLLAESAAPSKASSDNSRQQQQLLASQQVKDEAWFQLMPQQQGSGILDFTSDKFDPLAALQESEERVRKENEWVGHCPRLNHIDQFRSYLPPTDPLYRNVVVTASKKTDDSNKSAPPKKKLGPFATVAENHRQGPFSMLYKLFEKRQRIRILVRYVNGIRGTLTGYLVAYDKHFNMILRDVDEVYCPRPNTNDYSKNDAINDMENENDNREEGELKATEQVVPSNLELELGRRTKALAQTTKKNSSHKNSKDWSLRQRHMQQILVRGDNVVMVYKAENEQSAWPKTAKSPTKSVHGRKPQIVPPEERVGTPGSLIYAHQKNQQQGNRQPLRKQPFGGVTGQVKRPLKR